MANFCPSCGASVGTDQAFCKACGADLREGTAATTPGVAPPAPAPAPPASAPLPPPPPQPLPQQQYPQQQYPPPTYTPAPLAPLSGPGWAAYVGAAACGVLAIATGLTWFGGNLSVDAFDVPFALLFSDTAQGGLPFGVVLVVVAAAGLAAGLLAPTGRGLAVTLLSVGAVAVVLMIWYVVRVVSDAQGARLFDVLSWGAWLAVLASAGIVTGGLALQIGGQGRRSGAV